MKEPDLKALDHEVLLHPFTPQVRHLEHGAIVITEGDGSRVRDAAGREFLDAMAGLWCVNVGYGRAEIADAVAEQIKKLAYYHSFASMANEPELHLAARLIELSPWPMSKVFFGNSGSDANDTQIKLAWTYHRLRGEPGRTKIISRRSSYHGVTIGAASLTGLESVHADFPLPLPGFVHVTPPHAYREARADEDDAAFVARLVAELEETIEREGAGTIAAFIAEPVMGAGGVLVPPVGYFEAVQPVLERHGILMIADEVICAFGRLGRWFGGELFGIRPDLVTLAKGLTSGYVPMSACLISERVFEPFEENPEKLGSFAHGYTYSGHPVAAAAGLANLELMADEKLIERAERLGDVLQPRLREALGEHPLVGQVRGLGLIAGVELVRDRGTGERFPAELGVGRRVHEACLEGGLIVRAVGDTLAISPPLIITEADVNEIVDTLATSVERIASELR